MRRRELLCAVGAVSLPTLPGLSGTAEASEEATDDAGDADTTPGVIERNRGLIIGLGTLATVGGLGWLVYKIRAADPAETQGDAPTSKLEREDLLAGGEAQNPLERLIQLANRPEAYPVMIGVTAAVTGLLAIAGFPAALAVGAYGILLFAMMAFLSIGWPIIEARFNGSGSTATDRDSLRFEGFSTDTKVFITLLVLLLGTMLGLIFVESLLR